MIWPRCESIPLNMPKFATNLRELFPHIYIVGTSSSPSSEWSWRYTINRKAGTGLMGSEK